MHFEGKNRAAHRVSYLLYKGPIPDGAEIQHTCDVRCCVNPDHLIPGSHLENMQASSKRNHYPDRKGMLHTQSKLTDNAVREIRASVFIKRGDQNILARKYGVHHNVIQKIRNGKMWEHVR